MLSPVEKIKAEKWASEVLKRLREDGNDPTPENFAVYYSYISDSNFALKTEVDSILKVQGKLDDRQCADLYRKHISFDSEYKALEISSSSIEREMKHVMEALGSMATGSTNYTQSLNDFSGVLSSSSTIDQIRGAMTHIMAETRTIVEQNQKLQEQLSQSTQQLIETQVNLDKVRKDSLIDPLTEVGNRKFFNAELARTVQAALEANAPMAMLIADIDHFKKFNDSFGHLIGDQVLRLVAKTLVENLKGRDVIARYGGEEFVILLPDTSVENAERVGNHLRESLATKQIRRKNTNETLGVVTISIGATEYYLHEDLEGFIARADAALYDAKSTGRNKVMCRTISEEEKAKIKE